MATDHIRRVALAYLLNDDLAADEDVGAGAPLAAIMRVPAQLVILSRLLREADFLMITRGRVTGVVRIGFSILRVARFLAGGLGITMRSRMYANLDADLKSAGEGLCAAWGSPGGGGSGGG